MNWYQNIHSLTNSFRLLSSLVAVPITLVLYIATYTDVLASCSPNFDVACHLILLSGLFLVSREGLYIESSCDQVHLALEGKGVDCLGTATVTPQRSVLQCLLRPKITNIPML